MFPVAGAGVAPVPQGVLDSGFDCGCRRRVGETQSAGFGGDAMAPMTNHCAAADARAQGTFAVKFEGGILFLAECRGLGLFVGECGGGQGRLTRLGSRRRSHRGL